MHCELVNILTKTHDPTERLCGGSMLSNECTMKNTKKSIASIISKPIERHKWLYRTCMHGKTFHFMCPRFTYWFLLKCVLSFFRWSCHDMGVVEWRKWPIKFVKTTMKLFQLLRSILNSLKMNTKRQRRRYLRWVGVTKRTVHSIFMARCNFVMDFTEFLCNCCIFHLIFYIVSNFLFSTFVLSFNFEPSALVSC